MIMVVVVGLRRGNNVKQSFAELKGKPKCPGRDRDRFDSQLSLTAVLSALLCRTYPVS